MKILWNQNPLATVVELDDHDKNLLWHRVKIARLESAICEAYCNLDPKYQEWCKTALKDKDFIAEARRNLDYAYICGDESHNGKLFDAYVSELTDEYVAELSSLHYGDCTCVACSCMKCQAELLVDVATIPGLGKHEASHIRGAFAPKDQSQPTLNDVLIELADFEPKDVPECGLPHVDRWREEVRRAREWLVTYQRTHFM
jgi:hypothetical protein